MVIMVNMVILVEMFIMVVMVTIFTKVIRVSIILRVVTVIILVLVIIVEMDIMVEIFIMVGKGLSYLTQVILGSQIWDLVKSTGHVLWQCDRALEIQRGLKSVKNKVK